MSRFKNIPDFDSLPPVKDMPKGCAWGVFDQNGKKDHLGCVNLLTPDVIQNAVKTVCEGVSVSLNWPINAIDKAGFDRKGLEHTIRSFQDTPLNIHAFDDEVAFNTQCSSQWDSLVHWMHQPTGLAYNGARPSKEALQQDFGRFDTEKALPTLNHWHERGGLVGRGVLLDYKSYADAKGIKYSPFESHAVTVETLEAVAAHQGTKFEFGDILIIRFGLTEALGAADGAEQARLLGSHQAVGVRGNEDTARWFWNHHFSAVAADNVAFEVLPPIMDDEGGRIGELSELVLHAYFLSLFGLNIGELWDLKSLSEHCKKFGRYEFLLTSSPLNVPGSVGSPPNALAIF